MRAREPHSEGLRERIWWGAGSNATAQWAARLGMNLQSSTLKNDETGEAFHVQQAAQIRAYRAAWKESGHTRTPRVSVSRSIFALVDDRDRAYFGGSGEGDDQIGFIDPTTRAIFGRSYAAEPDVLIEELKKDEAIAEADTLLLTVPEPARRRLQRPRHRNDPETRCAGVGVALEARWILSETTTFSPVIASAAKQSSATSKNWIASSQQLLAMTQRRLTQRDRS